ncbi:calcium-binding protein [Aureimonas psammosilenae]|uniref:calcium-binding protein n=1 Tax=Aureimonas psammosilenae TaxID=2495496 RepID=UPI001869AC5B|nr:calcium-binding protein [Aureimonas psammosilenae]
MASVPTSGDDVLVGASGPDAIDGLGGNDEILGTGGADDLKGGDGNDVIYGGADKGDDTITDSGLNGDTAMYGGAGNDTLRITAPGSQWSYTQASLYGEDGNDTLDAGNSRYFMLDGGTGNDVLIGGTGYGSLLGGDGDDTLDASRSTYGSTSQLISLNGGAGKDTLIGSAGADSLYGDTGDDALNGGGGNDTLEGGLGADTLTGGDGADFLSGGAGRDMLTGDAGVDTYQGQRLDTYDPDTGMFVYSNSLNGDTITDYQNGEKISLGTNLASAAQVQLATVGANTELRIDTDNNGSFDTTITLQGTIAGTLLVTSEGGLTNNIISIALRRIKR